MGPAYQAMAPPGPPPLTPRKGGEKSHRNSSHSELSTEPLFHHPASRVHDADGLRLAIRSELRDGKRGRMELSAETAPKRNIPGPQCASLRMADRPRSRLALQPGKRRPAKAGSHLRAVALASDRIRHKEIGADGILTEIIPLATRAR